MRFRFVRTATVALAGLLPGLLATGCGSSGKGANTAAAVTTRTQATRPAAIVSGTPQILPNDVAHYATYGYSAYTTGAGDDQGRKLDLMPVGYQGSTHAARLMSYFSMSDVHLIDKESPAQAPFVGWTAGFGSGGLFSAGWSPIATGTTQVLDAAVKTVNAVHRQTPLDFGICLGDVSNCAQRNEVRWFIDVMDGKPITPSSGAHIGASTIDYQKPYQATGLDRSIPWYEIVGNHDQFFMGGAFPTAKIRAAMVGSQVLNMNPNISAAMATEGSGMYVGVVDGSTPYGEVVKYGPTAHYATAPTVAPDPDRRSLTTEASMTAGYIAEFRDSTSLPQGHGFDPTHTGNLAACYTFLPKSNLPLKVIVLDDTCKVNSNTATSEEFSSGWMDAERVTWLKDELQQGQDAGQLMILACHVPMNPQADLFKTTASPQFAVESPVQEPAMMATLHHYPNLVLLMAGHRHMNTVTPQPSPDPTHPEYGFWEVETSSLRDFPRGFRTWEVLRNRDNSISVMTTDVEPIVEPGSVAAKSLGYAVGAYRLFGGTTLTDTSPHVYNAELVKLLTPAMQTKIASLGTAVTATRAK